MVSLVLPLLDYVDSWVVVDIVLAEGVAVNSESNSDIM
jgi:hypothetical protein